MAVRNKMPEENFFDALEMLSRERGIPVTEATWEKILAAAQE